MRSEEQDSAKTGNDNDRGGYSYGCMIGRLPWFHRAKADGALFGNVSTRTNPVPVNETQNGAVLCVPPNNTVTLELSDASLSGTLKKKCGFPAEGFQKRAIVQWKFFKIVPVMG